MYRGVMSTTETATEESNLVTYAREELRRAGLFDEDSDYEGMLADAVMETVQVFANAGHSGMSAGMAIEILNKVLRFEPLTPLTYLEDEWVQVADEMAGDGPLWQNRRKFDVFSHDHGATWYCLDGTSGTRG